MFSFHLTGSDKTLHLHRQDQQVYSVFNEHALSPKKLKQMQTPHLKAPFKREEQLLNTHTHLEGCSIHLSCSCPLSTLRNQKPVVSHHSML